MKKTFFLLLASCFLLLLSSCSLRKPATAITADIATRGMAAVESEEDLYVAKESALPLIKIVEVLSYGDPENKKFQGLLAKVYGNYAFGFGEIELLKCNSNPPNPPLVKGGEGGLCSDWLNRTKRFYAKGKQSGVKALTESKKTPETVPMQDFPKYLKRFGKKDLSSLFWTAFNWGSYINMNRDDIIEAANLPRVEAMVDRVIEIDPAFNCGAAYAFKGALLAGNPLRNGGKPETAKPYFEKALLSCDGKYLMNKVMYAEWYGGGMNDKLLIKKELNDVLNADASVLPSQRLANELAKERAKLLLGVCP